MAGKAVPSPSIPLMCIRPWILSFFIRGTATWRAIFKCPLFGEVWSCTQRTGCKMDRGWKTCVYYREAAYVQTWFILSVFLDNFSSHECMREYVLMYTVYGLCACRILSNGPISDVSSAAHNWKSSSGSQSKAFWSYHFHWIYKVQLKSGAVQSHEWHKR